MWLHSLLLFRLVLLWLLYRVGLLVELGRLLRLELGVVRARDVFVVVPQAAQLLLFFCQHVVADFHALLLQLLQVLLLLVQVLLQVDLARVLLSQRLLRARVEITRAPLLLRQRVSQLAALLQGVFLRFLLHRLHLVVRLARLLLQLHVLDLHVLVRRSDTTRQATRACTALLARLLVRVRLFMQPDELFVALLIVWVLLLQLLVRLLLRILQLGLRLCGCLLLLQAFFAT